MNFCVISSAIVEEVVTDKTYNVGDIICVDENSDTRLFGLVAREEKRIVERNEHSFVNSFIFVYSINQSIKICIAPFKIPTQKRSRPRPSRKEQS